MKNQSSEKNHPDNASEEMQDLAAQIADRAGDGIIVVQDAVLVYANAAFALMTGRQPEELPGSDLATLFTPEAAAVVEQRSQERMWGRESSPVFRLDVLGSEGRTIPVEASGSLIERDGELADLLILRDITHQQQVEALLAEAAAHWEGILRQLPEMLLVFGEHDELVLSSSACQEFTGQDPEEFLGKSKWQVFEELNLLAPRCAEEVKEKTIDSLQRGERLRGVAVEGFDRNGNRVPLRYSAEKIGDTSGKKAGEVVVINDMSPLQALQDELMATVQKLKASQMEISTPVVQVWDRILALPLIGTVDSHRARSIMDTLLGRIADTQAEMVILDITGVSAVDTHVANHLIETVEAANMLGTECVITGIKPEIAQTMIHLGLDVASFPTRRNLRDGLLYGLQKLGYEVRVAGD